jgi:hypothetical protein
MLRSELGEKGYQAFVQWWSREAHMDLYFEFLRKTATKKFGHVPWEKEEGTDQLELWNSVKIQDRRLNEIK